MRLKASSGQYHITVDGAGLNSLLNPSLIWNVWFLLSCCKADRNQMKVVDSLRIQLNVPFSLLYSVMFSVGDGLLQASV